MPRLMLDSGAFSVWTKGETIDIDDYIRFCLDNPGVSYYIVLDVIAGGNRRDSDIESAEQATWDNYQYMLRQGLPMEKVMPVVHRGLGHTKWLEKYIDFGSPYIGFGQVGFFGNLASQKRDLDPISKVIFDSTGKAIVRTHGLAVTSFPLMKAFR